MRNHNWSWNIYVLKVEMEALQTYPCEACATHAQIFRACQLLWSLHKMVSYSWLTIHHQRKGKRRVHHLTRNCMCSRYTHGFKAGFKGMDFEFGCYSRSRVAVYSWVSRVWTCDSWLGQAAVAFNSGILEPNLANSPTPLTMMRVTPRPKVHSFRTNTKQ